MPQSGELRLAVSGLVASCQLLIASLVAVSLKRPYELHQASDSDSGRALGDPALVVINPGRAGDIEMEPGRVFSKFLEEDGSSAGAAAALETAAS